MARSVGALAAHGRWLTPAEPDATFVSITLDTGTTTGPLKEKVVALATNTGRV